MLGIELQLLAQRGKLRTELVKLDGRGVQPAGQRRAGRIEDFPAAAPLAQQQRQPAPAGRRHQ